MYKHSPNTNNLNQKKSLSKEDKTVTLSDNIEYNERDEKDDEKMEYSDNEKGGLANADFEKKVEKGEGNKTKASDVHIEESKITKDTQKKKEMVDRNRRQGNALISNLSKLNNNNSKNTSSFTNSKAKGTRDIAQKYNANSDGMYSTASVPTSKLQNSKGAIKTGKAAVPKQGKEVEFAEEELHIDGFQYNEEDGRYDMINEVDEWAESEDVSCLILLRLLYMKMTFHRYLYLVCDAVMVTL